MKSDFMVKTAKIIAEVRNRTCIDEDAEVLEVIKEILQEELKEYYNEVFTYTRNIGYDEGYERGYAVGHDDGYAGGYTDGHESSLGEAVNRAYEEGYAAGYYVGNSVGYSDGHSDGHSEVITLIKLRYNMGDYSIKLGDSVGSGAHVYSQGEIYPVIQMYIGQEKAFTYANKVLP